MFHFIVLLIPVFNCSKRFMSFCNDKVTTGTYNLVSFILNVASNGTTIAELAPCASFLSYQVKHYF